MRFDCPFCQRAYRIAAESLPHGLRATMTCAVCRGKVDLRRGDGDVVVCLPERKQRSSATTLSAQQPLVQPEEEKAQAPVATVPRAHQLFPQFSPAPSPVQPAAPRGAAAPGAAAPAAKPTLSVLAQLTADTPMATPAMERPREKRQIAQEFSVLFRLDRRSRRQGQMIGALTVVLLLILGGLGYWQIRSQRAAPLEQAVVRPVQPVADQGPSAFTRCADIMDLAGETVARYTAPALPARAPGPPPTPAPPAPAADSDASTPVMEPTAQVAFSQSEQPVKREPASALRNGPGDAGHRQAKLAAPSVKRVAAPNSLPVLRSYRMRQAWPMPNALATRRSDGSDLRRASAMNR